jgi:hypothetical protein
MRVIAPSELREPVIDLLNDNPGVAHLVVHPAAAVNPVGDEITADIARESANDVVDELKALGLKERGAITMEALDTVLSTRAYRAEDEAEGEPADAVIWDELVSRTREESTLTITYLMFLCIACMIAAVGVVTDSPVTIVGAMVVGPEFGPAGWPRNRPRSWRSTSSASWWPVYWCCGFTSVGTPADTRCARLTLRAMRTAARCDGIG